MLASLTSWLTPSSLFLVLNIVIGTILLISRFTSSRRPPYHYHQPPGPDYGVASLLERVKSFDFSFYKYDHLNHEAPFVHPSEPQYTSPPPLERTPSFLKRVKSISFSLYNFAPSYSESDCVSHPEPEYEAPQPDSPQLSRTPSFLERVKSITSFYRSNSIKGNPETEFPPEPQTDPGTDMVREHGPVHGSKSESQVTQRSLPEKITKSASKNSRHKEDDEEVERRRPQTARMERTASFGESGDVDAKADDFINSFKQQLKLQRQDSFLRYREMFKGK